MGVMVYKKEGGKVKAARIVHTSIKAYEQSGWSLTIPKRGITKQEPEADAQLKNEELKIDSGKDNLNLSNIRLLAKEKGIEDWDTKVPELLIKELRDPS